MYRNSEKCRNPLMMNKARSRKRLRLSTIDTLSISCWLFFIFFFFYLHKIIIRNIKNMIRAISNKNKIKFIIEKLYLYSTSIRIIDISKYIEN